MQTIIIFLIIFFLILILLYPLIRLVYFLSSKKTVQNKVLNIIVMIVGFISVYFIVKNQTNTIMSLNLGDYINSKKGLIIIAITIFIGNIIETIINSLINLFIKRRVRNK